MCPTFLECVIRDCSVGAIKTVYFAVCVKAEGGVRLHIRNPLCHCERTNLLRRSTGCENVRDVLQAGNRIDVKY